MFQRQLEDISVEHFDIVQPDQNKWECKLFRHRSAEPQYRPLGCIIPGHAFSQRPPFSTTNNIVLCTIVVAVYGDLICFSMAERDQKRRKYY